MNDGTWTPGTGELINARYELIAPLGKGGMAQVWRARDTATGQEVAVKFLRLDTEVLSRFDTRDRLAEIDVLTKRFRREADLLRRLDHSGICAYLGHGLHQDVPYLAMSLVIGINLRTFLDEHSPLPLATGVAVAARIAEALVCAHTLPVVHRDLKPHNVMISEQGDVTLIDFGIARPLWSNATRHTLHGSTLGSRGYQAPEQIMEKEPTTKTDVYSFGCVLYELLTGRPPFPLSEESGLVEKHLKELPDPPSTYAAGIPAALDDLVLRMLAKEPEQRPAVEDVLRAVAPFRPEPGDPEPNPCTHPDPTAPDRLLRDRPADVRPNPTVAPPAPGASDEWLDARAVERLCAAAAREITQGEPGEAAHALSGMTDRVLDEWGARRPLVRRVWTLAADGLRLAGDFGSAAKLYQETADGLLHGEGPAERAERTVLRLRAAECRLAFGDMEAAIDMVVEAGRTAAGLPAEFAERVEDVRRAVDAAIAERIADDGDDRTGC